MKLLSITIAIAALFFAQTSTLSQVPNTLPVQGQLFQNNGLPISDGNHTVTIRMYSSATGGESTVLCDACETPFRDGVFQIMLGAEGMIPLPKLSSPLFLEFTVDGEVLRPRVEMGSVAFAHEAAHVVQQKGGIPVGTILAMASAPSEDSDYMIADGRDMSSTEYPELFAAIGRTWGSGGTSGTDETDFNIPDLRGVFLRGDDYGSGRDKNFLDRQPARKADGTTVGSYQFVGEMPVSEPYGEYVDNGDLVTRKRPGRTTYQSIRLEDAAKAVPNAAVVYVIKVR